MERQTNLFENQVPIWTVFPSRKSDRRAMIDRFGTCTLYRGPEEGHARVTMHHTAMCARMPAFMAETLPTGRTGQMFQEFPPRKRRIR